MDIEMGEQSRERANVLVVVPHDLDEICSGATPQESEVAARDLPAFDIADAVKAEQFRLGGTEAGIRHAMAKEPPDDRQEIEVARMCRWRLPGKPIPGDQQGPVEATPVVGHEPGIRRDRRLQGPEQRAFLAVVGEEELHLPKMIRFPPAEADEERNRTRGGRESRRLRVQADERRVAGRLTRQRREANAVHRQDPRGRLAADDHAVRAPHDLTVESIRQTYREVVAARTDRWRWRSMTTRRAVSLEPTSQGRAGVDHGRYLR